jgi:hypothetical protein
VSAREQLLEDSWSKGLDEESKQSPVQRVISLLQNMKGDLEAEAKKGV